jgi:hypothetical protein
VAEGAEVALGQEIGVAVSAERQGRSAERRGLYDADRATYRLHTYIPLKATLFLVPS